MKGPVLSHVVSTAGSILCPSCSAVLDAERGSINYNSPPPEKVGMRCLNSRCAEYRALKLVPLARVEVTVEIEEEEPDDGRC